MHGPFGPERDGRSIIPLAAGDVEATRAQSFAHRPGKPGDVERVRRLQQHGTEGVTEGHPASIENPFNGEIITVFDLGGNNVERGGMSYVTIGAAPGYTFSEARPEIMYLDGAPGAGDPFKHNHPQLAVDPNSGVIIVGHNANGSAVGNPDADARAERLFVPALR